MSSYPWGPHGPQSDPNSVTPNPTPAYVPPPSSSGWDDSTATAPQPSYGGGGGGGSYGGGYAGPSGPRRKSYVLAVILSAVFGPLGLFYASKKGALILLLVLVGVPITLGFLGPPYFPYRATSPIQVLDDTRIMNPMWSTCAFLSVVWAVVAVRIRNRALAG